jgi:hypothetical protein
MVSFWKPSGSDVFGYNLTRSAVWNADFPGFTSAGTYRLAIAGVGASQDFTLANNIYANPFRVTLRGFYYMRIGRTTRPASRRRRARRLHPGLEPGEHRRLSHDRDAVGRFLEPDLA